MNNNKFALVTGAGKGIGRTLAIEFAKEGYSIGINYRSNDEEALEIKEICEKNGVKAILLKADVSKFEECENIYKILKDEFGKIDVLINNAGITKDNLIIKMSLRRILC